MEELSWQRRALSHSSGPTTGNTLKRLKDGWPRNMSLPQLHHQGTPQREALAIQVTYSLQGLLALLCTGSSSAGGGSNTRAHCGVSSRNKQQRSGSSEKHRSCSISQSVKMTGSVESFVLGFSVRWQEILGYGAPHGTDLVVLRTITTMLRTALNTHFLTFISTAKWSELKPFCMCINGENTSFSKHWQLIARW